MREIVMDTETTGFEAEKDDRIVEIGGIELLNHLPTGRTFHVYINPERPMPKDAFEVHAWATTSCATSRDLRTLFKASSTSSATTPAW